MKSNLPTRIVILSDLHCGHQWAICHPNFETHSLDDAAKVRKQLWKWFDSEIAKLSPIDVLVVNGDAIDGDGYRNSGIEQLTTDRNKQSENAAAIIKHLKAKEIYLVKGTRAHTGLAEDFEETLAKLVKPIAIETELHLTKRGTVLNFKHKGSASANPHAMSPAMARAAVWDELKAVRGIKPGDKPADITIRSHIHTYYNLADEFTEIITTPALQYLSDYGARNFEGWTTVGFIVIDVYDDHHITIPHLWRPKTLGKMYS